MQPIDNLIHTLTLLLAAYQSNYPQNPSELNDERFVAGFTAGFCAGARSAYQDALNRATEVRDRQTVRAVS